MTVHSIKLTLLYASLLCGLVGILACAVMASANGKPITSPLGVIRREPSRSREALTQTPEVRREQEGAPAGKRKPLHEYGPEDVHPEARENEKPTLKKAPSPQPRAGNLAPRSTASPAPRAPVALTPAATPSPVELSSPAPAMTRPTPQKLKSPEAPRSETIRSDALRRKLLINSSIFLALLMSLVFFGIKMRRQLRADRRDARRESSQEQLAAGARQLRVVGQAGGEKRVNRSDVGPGGVKTKARNERGARYKKA